MRHLILFTTATADYPVLLSLILLSPLLTSLLLTHSFFFLFSFLLSSFFLSLLLSLFFPSPLSFSFYRLQKQVTEEAARSAVKQSKRCDDAIAEFQRELTKNSKALSEMSTREKEREKEKEKMALKK